MKLPAVDRRTLLIGGGAAAGLVIGFLVWPRREGTALRARGQDRLVNAYLRIGADDRVTLAVPQVEVGQGVWTGLAQIAADELGADMGRMAVEPAPFDGQFANPLVIGPDYQPLRVTANGTSIRAFGQPVRDAAAMARDLLIRAAAERWGISAAECDTANGSVIHEGKTLRFGEVAGDAATLAPADSVTLRPSGEGKVVGQSVPRLELGPKSDGSFRFAADVRLPGMLFASVRMAPIGGRIVSHSDEAATGQRGFRKMVVRDAWIAAVGDSWWAAERALVRAKVVRSGPSIERPVMPTLLEQVETGERATLLSAGDYAGAVEGSRPLAATYSMAPLPHRSLEPPAVVARFSGDRLEVWAATRVPDLARSIAAGRAGLPETQTTLYPMPLGDGSGSGFDLDVIPIAVEIARDVGRPVCLSLAPEEAQHFDTMRSPVAAKMAALPNPAGGIAAWSARIAGMAGLEATLASIAGKEPPGFAPIGAAPPYSIPAVRIEAVSANLPIRPSYWRGGDPAMMTFATESFVDELARAAGMDPLIYRIGMLGGSPRLARVLTTATAIGGWDGGGPGSSMGLACSALQGSFIGLVATASIGSTQRIEVSKMTAAVDCGRMVNPDLVKQQVEGALLVALAAATLPSPEIAGGMTRATTLSGKSFERLDRVPEITVELIGSDDEPGGVSGLGMAVLAPAVANALAASTGRRLRNLPFDPMAA